MAKGKSRSQKDSHKHLHSRISFLYQASTYLSSSLPCNGPCSVTPLSRLYTAHLRSVALRSTIRLTPSLKHTICKRCDTHLTPGVSCNTFLENKSRAGRKPWADVLVRQCDACGAVKRFPVGAKRQVRGENRRGKAQRPAKNGRRDG